MVEDGKYNPENARVSQFLSELADIEASTGLPGSYVDKVLELPNNARENDRILQKATYKSRGRAS